MRIGIDGYNLAMPRGTGVATYGFTLARAVKALGYSLDGVFGLDVGKTEQMREVMFYDALGSEQKDRRRPKHIQKMVGAFGSLVFGARSKIVPITDLVQKETFADHMPTFDRLYSSPALFELAHEYLAYFGRMLTLHVKQPPDIMHWTYPVPVHLAGSKNIYTLHDLVPLRLPYTTLDVKNNYFKLIELCTKNAVHLCTVSESSRADIISRFGVPEQKITNTYQASPLPADIGLSTPEADAEMIHGIFDLPHRGYFLFFGAIEPKKNVGRLIEAYLSINSETPLVVVGARAWQSERELQLVNGYGRTTGRIIQLEYLPRALLMRLIRCAKAVIFPSLYEGFGLPLLEAMQLGTPVLSSETSSLPEVAGEAAILVNPYSVRDIAEAMRKLDDSSELRAELAAKGLQQGMVFSEARYHEKLARMYSDIEGIAP